ALPLAFASLFNLTGNNLTAALDQLSGEPDRRAEGRIPDDRSVPRHDAGSVRRRPLRDDPHRLSPARARVRREALGAWFCTERETVPSEISLAYASVLKEPRAPLAPIYEPRWTAWGGAYGGSNHTSGDIASVRQHGRLRRRLRLSLHPRHGPRLCLR